MSFVITSTATVFAAPTTVAAPPAGSNPNAVVATGTPVQLGGVNTTYTTAPAAAGQTQNIVVSGSGTRVNVAPGAANINVIGGGSIVESTQATTDASPKTISMGSSNYNGGTVNVLASVTGNTAGSTVNVVSAAGAQGPATGFAYYAHGGIGADQIEGSSQADFIRGGAGNDTINGFGGNDVIRGGAGSDSIFTGTGSDTVYYTADQFDGSTDQIVDFTSGTDKISVSSSVVASTAAITGLGTKTIKFNGAGNTSVTVTSGNSNISASDINFI
jgi:Ca2+-binding RTX toxin-like protein